MLSVTTETCMNHIDSLLKIRFAIPARSLLLVKILFVRVLLPTTVEERSELFRNTLFKMVLTVGSAPEN